MGTLNERVTAGLKAGNHWANNFHSHNSPSSVDNDPKIDTAKDDIQINTDIQDQSAKPVMIGFDVVGLYPNLDPISVAKITADAVRETSVRFKSIDYMTLTVYLTLVLGTVTMSKLGLSDCIPKRRNKKNSSNSLISPNNRNLECWHMEHIRLTEWHKRELLALMLQVMVLLMTSTTCYKFGGSIYRQKKGLGIGLRGSAALARIVMCKWDCLWGGLMYKLGINLLLIYRYVDDLRLMLRPIKAGWFWACNKWIFDPARQDLRDPTTRTKEELLKSLNSTWDFLKFTCEGESDYSDGFLPTLDYSTKVQPDGYILYKFFSKQMARNQLLSYGTALSKGCIFSSLRQDLVRRLYNTDREMGTQCRLQIIKQFIQLAVNGGHKFQFIKSVVLQGISKYVYMVSRSELPEDNKKYSPLHRAKTFDSHRRKLLKYTNQATWFTNNSFDDKFKNGWKSWIVRKQDRRNISKHNMKRGQLLNKQVKMPPTTTVLFVPKTENATLINMLQDTEDEMSPKIGWGTKLIEKPGTPLLIKFIRQFPMGDGCARGKNCTVCDNNGCKCMTKRVVYLATCQDCAPKLESNGELEQVTEVGGISQMSDLEVGTYVRETSRQFGTRVMKHYKNLKDYKKESFMIQHWMQEHGLQTTPPTFKFQILGVHKDALSRQLHEAIQIRTRGNLNKRSEFAINELIRMESTKYAWQYEKDNRVAARQELIHEESLLNFINVMKTLNNCAGNFHKRKKRAHADNVDIYRFLTKQETPVATDREQGETTSTVEQVGLLLDLDSDILCEEIDTRTDFRPSKKRKEMDTSTPLRPRSTQQIMLASSPIDNLQLDLDALTVGKEDDSRERDQEPKDWRVDLDLRILEISSPNEGCPYQTMAERVVGANNHLDAVESYRHRTLSFPEQSRRSWEISQDSTRSRSLSLDSSMQGVDIRDWSTLDKFKSYHSDPDPEESSLDSYNLELLFGPIAHVDWFGESHLNDTRLEAAIVEQAKNKLYKIFARECPNVAKYKKCGPRGVGIMTASCKRKSSLENMRPGKIPQLKHRQLTIDEIFGAPRTRSNTISGAQTNNRPVSRGSKPNNKTRRPRSHSINRGSQSRLITLWKRNFPQDQEKSPEGDEKEN